MNSWLCVTTSVISMAYVSRGNVIVEMAFMDSSVSISMECYLIIIIL